jgi:hypothetical protein
MKDYFLLLVKVAPDGSITNTLQQINDVDLFMEESAENLDLLDGYSLNLSDIGVHVQQPNTKATNSKTPSPGLYYCLIDDGNSTILGKATSESQEKNIYLNLQNQTL